MHTTKVVCIQLNSLRFSGAERVYNDIIPFFIKDRYKVHIVATGTDLGEYAENLRRMGAEIHHFPIGIRSLIGLAKYLKKQNPIIVHINRDGFSLLFAIITRLFTNARIIRTYHAVFNSRGRYLFGLSRHLWQVYKILQRNLLNIFIDYGISVSSVVKQNELNRFNNKTILLPSALNTRGYEVLAPHEKTTLQMKLKIDPEYFYIITIGNCASVKNHILLFKALLTLSDAKIKLLHIGNGVLTQKEMRFVRENGVAEKVLFLGTIENVLPYLQSADVFAMPSFFEGQSLALLEALSSGLPCLVSEISVFAWLKEEKSVEFHNPNNVNEFVQKVNLIKQNYQTYKKEAYDLSERIKRDYSIEVYYKNLLKIYQLSNDCTN